MIDDFVTRRAPPSDDRSDGLSLLRAIRNALAIEVVVGLALGGIFCAVVAVANNWPAISAAVRGWL